MISLTFVAETNDTFWVVLQYLQQDYQRQLICCGVPWPKALMGLCEFE